MGKGSSVGRSARQALGRDFGTSGRENSRALSGVLKGIRGKGGEKAVQAAKDANHAMGAAGQSAASQRRAAALVTRAEKMVGQSGARGALSTAKWAKIASAGARGLLSPAGLAEGVAGAASKVALQEKFKREARAESKPTKGGMKRVKTKA